MEKIISENCSKYGVGCTCLILILFFHNNDKLVKKLIENIINTVSVAVIKVKNSVGWSGAVGHLETLFDRVSDFIIESPLFLKYEQIMTIPMNN